MEVNIGRIAPIRLIISMAGRTTKKAKIIETIGINNHDTNERDSRIDSGGPDWIVVARAVKRKSK